MSTLGTPAVAPDDLRSTRVHDRPDAYPRVRRDEAVLFGQTIHPCPACSGAFYSEDATLVASCSRASGRPRSAVAHLALKAMNAKVFISIVSTNVLAGYLLFFSSTENFSLPGESPSSSEGLTVAIGFFLALPSLPMVYVLDEVLHPRWAAINTWILGSVLSAAIWSFAAQQLNARYRGRSVDPHGGAPHPEHLPS